MLGYAAVVSSRSPRLTSEHTPAPAPEHTPPLAPSRAPSLVLARAPVLVLALALSVGVLAACADADGSLFVDVRTDYAQVAEFDAVEVQVADRTLRHEAEALSDYGAGVRVAELEGLPRGPTVVVARLLLGTTRVADASMTVTIGDRTALTLEILRGCAGDCSDAGVAPDAGVSEDAGVEPDVDGGVDGGVASGSDGGAASCISRPQTVEADTVITRSVCDGSVDFGGEPYLNLSVGDAHGLFRFALDDEATSLLASGVVHGARLVLTRATTCDGMLCPAAPGVIAARPMRNDWVEGNSTPGSGADWCRRTASTGMARGWGIPGADRADVDVGPTAGSAMFDTVSEQVVIPLDPAVLRADWMSRGSAAQISIQTECGSGTLVVQSREATGGVAAVLELDVCR